MSVTTKDAWADRYDQAAGDLLGEPVVAAAQFLRPRGWRELGRALTGPPATVLARTTGRTRRVRLPGACLVAVTDDAVHVLQARMEVGSGPVPRAIRPLAAWDRSDLSVAVEADGLGTRLTVVPAGGAPVELLGPPGTLTDRVVRALAGEVEEPATRPAEPTRPAQPTQPLHAAPPPAAPAAQAPPSAA